MATLKSTAIRCTVRFAGSQFTIYVEDGTRRYLEQMQTAQLRLLNTKNSRREILLQSARKRTET